jgi:hypothetical protein
VSFSQNVEPATPDEGVLLFVEDQLKCSGRLDGVSTLAFLLGRSPVTPQEKAGFRLVLAMYGDRVDPSAHAMIRAAISAKA